MFAFVFKAPTGDDGCFRTLRVLILHLENESIKNRNIEVVWTESLSELSKMNGRGYVRFATPELAAQFLQQANAEGFTFPNSAKPTSREAAEIMAVSPDHTLKYVGTVGHIAYGVAERVCSKRLIRINFQYGLAGKTHREN